jgi:hypothetical protein
MQSRSKNSPKIWYDPSEDYQYEEVKFEKIPKKKKIRVKDKEKKHGSDEEAEG